MYLRNILKIELHFAVLNETDSSYRTRSLPAWGKGSKQRPVSTTDDMEELYAKVNQNILLQHNSYYINILLNFFY